MRENKTKYSKIFSVIKKIGMIFSCAFTVLVLVGFIAACLTRPVDIRNSLYNYSFGWIDVRKDNFIYQDNNKVGETIGYVRVKEGFIEFNNIVKASSLDTNKPVYYKKYKCTITNYKEKSGLVHFEKYGLLDNVYKEVICEIID